MAAGFAVGALVRTRGREWVVLPDSEDDFLLLRPLGGTDDEIAGIHLGLEEVRSATLPLPSADDLGDHRSGRLLRDAVRLGFRDSAGPFRSFGRIACDPRPYQLVPLLMALKQDPVRLLIADDVGIGKTIEAALIARELFDRGEVQRIAVLCPPHLAEQWQREFSQKFNLEFELVLAGTARRLEQACAANQSLFEVYPHVIVSTDYIKSDRRREDFLRACPEFVIVDEAHTCAATAETGWGRHQRHQVLKGLARDPERHLLLVTATPHSGKDDAFRSLLSLLNPEFAALPDDLAGEANRKQRERLAAHLVQRRRADIKHYLDADTPFPGREEAEETYKLHLEYLDLFRRALDYARETVQDTAGGAFRQRIRWWSVLALLRSLASSPAAAVDTLTSRSSSADAESEPEADEIGKRTVMDALDDTASEGTDVAPGSDPGDEGEDARSRRQLREMAKVAEGLKGEKDAKLQKAKRLIKGLIDAGFNPIVFCRFIPTAEYLAVKLRAALPRKVAVEAVTGLLPPADREARVLALAAEERRVLVCTDCLSEGINLQDHFDAVLHYDLAWNPTRHEQREGRVDRYGQQKKVVRVLTYYGTDNAIDGVVLEVLLKKHRKIRGSLGISVPVPLDTEKVMSAILHAALLRREGGQLTLDLARDDQQELETQWEAAAEREKLSRTLFAQYSIRPEEVGAELQQTRAAIGSGVDVERFVREVFSAHGAIVSGTDPVKIQLKEVPAAVRDAIRDQRDSEELKVRFELPVGDGVIHLHRTHPIVEGLAGHVLDSTLDPVLADTAVARRSGVIRTREVATRTTVVLLRLRYHLLTTIKGGGERALLAEDCRLAAFRGAGDNAEWLAEQDAEALLAANPSANVSADQAQHFLGRTLEAIPSMAPAFEKLAHENAARILAAHERVREATKARGVRNRVEPKLPVDVLGVYVYLPAGGVE
jgi:superfamily II DNA or RNA helicase